MTISIAQPPAVNASMSDPMTLAALRQVINDQIGPRRPGAIYQNIDGCFEVLALVTVPADAAQLLRRAAARWAVVVRDTLRPDGQPFAVGSVWTTSDYLIRPALDSPVDAAAA
ncbi:hypothetical protein SAMN05216532_8350 [Streptomyces sp. 2231.1]|uniref:hypothetical protein n=1 Tax=Streptomyces sp. 2231.1 TaxID=1855347 RepID=UPI000895FD78|nr:hypothetical protein [Streptomyces sp. 2231.1]SEE67820.1 hypothetical protein SAMN05216532_8350 [Streptomyces sp. 2231.1]